MVAASGMSLSRGPLVRVSSASQGSIPLSVDVMRQIQALNAEKESRTPAQKKLDSQLVYAIKQRNGQAVAAGGPMLEVNVGADASGMVTGDISADVTDE